MAPETSLSVNYFTSFCSCHPPPWHPHAEPARCDFFSLESRAQFQFRSKSVSLHLALGPRSREPLSPTFPSPEHRRLPARCAERVVPAYGGDALASSRGTLTRSLDASRSQPISHHSRSMKKNLLTCYPTHCSRNIDCMYNSVPRSINQSWCIAARMLWEAPLLIPLGIWQSFQRVMRPLLKNVQNPSSANRS